MKLFISKEERKRKKILKKNMDLNSDNIIELRNQILNIKLELEKKYDEINVLRETLLEKDYFINVINEVNKRISDIKIQLSNELNENYVKLVDEMFNKTIEILNDNKNKYDEYFNYYNDKFIDIEKQYLSVNNKVEDFKILEENYKKIALNIIDDKIAQEIPIQKTSEIASMKILEAFNQELKDLGKEEKESIHKAIIDVLMSKKIIISNSQQREIKPLAENSKFHKSYNVLKNYVLAGVIPMIVGPSGSGKSHAIEQLASDLQLNFYMANRIQNTFELVGFVNAAGNYVTTQFYEAFTKGGIFFFDEVDASSPEALVTINAAVAQGYMAFPGHPTSIDMHQDFKVVVAGNTYGTGSTIQYTGRNKLDAATLDRFMVIDWDYDKKLEDSLIKDKDLLEICWDLRENSKQYDEVIISTRGIITLEKIISQEKNNKTLELDYIFIKKFFASLDKQKLSKIIASLDKNKLKNNKYYNIVNKIK